MDGATHQSRRAHGTGDSLRYALELLEGWTVIPDNTQLRIDGDGVTHATVTETIDKMRAPGFWRDRGFQRAILSRLPEYRLSKFQRALPEAASLEMVGRYMLDFAGAERFLG